jgi:hypothetical protein
MLQAFVESRGNKFQVLGRFANGRPADDVRRMTASPAGRPGHVNITLWMVGRIDPIHIGPLPLKGFVVTIPEDTVPPFAAPAAPANG